MTWCLSKADFKYCFESLGCIRLRDKCRDPLAFLDLIPMNRETLGGQASPAPVHLRELPALVSKNARVELEY